MDFTKMYDQFMDYNTRFIIPFFFSCQEDCIVCVKSVTIRKICIASKYSFWILDCLLTKIAQKVHVNIIKENK